MPSRSSRVPPPIGARTGQDQDHRVQTGLVSVHIMNRFVSLSGTRDDGGMPSSPDTYLHGHHDSVLRSHRWRTAENSAGYLLPRLVPNARVLDVGCGPGTITAGLAALGPRGGGAG